MCEVFERKGKVCTFEEKTKLIEGIHPNGNFFSYISSTHPPNWNKVSDKGERLAIATRIEVVKAKNRKERHTPYGTTYAARR